MTATPNNGHLSGLRAIAIFEAAKAALILLTGFGLLSLIHHDVEAIAVQLVHHLHLNPASRYPKIFIDASRQLTDARLWTLAVLAFIDALIRALEGYGLWRGRAWAEWVGLVSGMIYIPIEIYELLWSVNFLKIFTLLANILIVAYLGYLIRRRQQLHAPTPS